MGKPKAPVEGLRGNARSAKKKRSRATRRQPSISKDASSAAHRGLDDYEAAHHLLDAVGVPHDISLAQRLLWVAKRWLSMCHHPDGCVCTQCFSSRKIVFAHHALQAEPDAGVTS